MTESFRDSFSWTIKWKPIMLYITFYCDVNMTELCGVMHLVQLWHHHQVFRGLWLLMNIVIGLIIILLQQNRFNIRTSGDLTSISNFFPLSFFWNDWFSTQNKIFHMGNCLNFLFFAFFCGCCLSLKYLYFFLG